MAEFEQSPATRQALHDAAVAYVRRPAAVAALAGTTDKKATAYRNAARRLQLMSAPATAKQRRPASKAALAKAVGSKMRVKVKAFYAPGDDPKYGRTRTLESDVDAAELLAQALSDEEESQDEAWQVFFDVYTLPSGTIENAHISFS